MKEEIAVEKESKPKQYSQEYMDALLEGVRQYVPPHVMENLHRQALPRAGGRASAKARAAQTAAQAQTTEARQAQNTQAEVNAEVEKQPIPADITPIPLPTNEKPLTPPAPPQLQPETCAEGDEACEAQASGSGPEQSTPVQQGKSKMDKEEMEKTAHGKQDAPIASTGSWDAGAAQKRLLAWAGGPDKDNVNWQKFGKGFLYHDPNNADNIKGYKFPVADIINGKFQISRAALGAAAGRINQSSGIPPDELNSMKATLRSYYKDIGEDAPDNISKASDGDLHPDCQKVADNCMKLKSGKGISKADVPTYIGQRPILTFVAASPGIMESIRKTALAGATGKTFNDEYLTPLGLTRNDVAITYLVPNLLKDEGGKVREPTAEEIEKWQPWFTDEIEKIESGNKLPIIALGHTVKKALDREVEFTLPHPNSLYTPRTKDELQRKRYQVSKALEARYRKN
jgi:uracil-DNA glycosylase family 4